MYKITVIGTGYVGLVSGTCLAEIGNQVVCADIDENKIDRLRQGIVPIFEPGLSDLMIRNTNENRLSFTTDIGEAVRNSEIVYIAVGTPMSDSGAADLKYVKSAAKSIGENLNEFKIIVVKSTVPVGTGKLVQEWIAKSRSDVSIPFEVASNPEFLREGSAIKDCMEMERAVIGARSEHAAAILRKLHEPFHTRVISTDVESAEMIKYAANAFLATKISFINSIANLCEKVGANISYVVEGIGADSRIGKQYLQAGIGYGGSCFPKDTVALKHIAENAECEFPILNSVIETNNKQRFVVIDKLKKALGGIQGKKISVLGLAFKPDTDDIRFAPSLDILPILVSMGATVVGCDPIAIDPVRNELRDLAIVYTRDWREALFQSDACLLLTDWEEYKAIKPSDILSLMNNPVVVDGRNSFELVQMQDHSIQYHSIGRPSVYSSQVAGVLSI